MPAPLILAVIGLGAFVTALDQTVVVTALPEMMLDLKIPVTRLDRASWIITAYLLGYTAVNPWSSWGKLDRLRACLTKPIARFRATRCRPILVSYGMTSLRIRQRISSCQRKTTP